MSDGNSRSFPYLCCTMNMAKKAEAYLKNLDNSISFDTNSHESYYQIDVQEGIWNFEKDGNNNLGYRIRYKEGYFPSLPTDQLVNLRSKIAKAMMSAGLEIDLNHHEVSTGGQAEFSMRFNSLARQVDNISLYKYVAKNIARKNGYAVTFMPKPLFQDNGSRMHVHQSLIDTNTGNNAFADTGDDYGLFMVARQFLASLLYYAHGMSLLLNLLVNSCKSLVKGYEAPVYATWARVNRSALIRVLRINPQRLETAELETRNPDPVCNPYLAYTLLLKCGLHCIRERMTLPPPVEENLFALDIVELQRRQIAHSPETLGEAITAFKDDPAVWEALDDLLCIKLLETKIQEWQDFCRHLTSWKLELYLGV